MLVEQGTYRDTLIQLLQDPNTLAQQIRKGLTKADFTDLVAKRDKAEIDPIYKEYADGALRYIVNDNFPILTHLLSLDLRDIHSLNKLRQLVPALVDIAVWLPDKLGKYKFPKIAKDNRLDFLQSFLNNLDFIGMTYFKNYELNQSWLQAVKILRTGGPFHTADIILPDSLLPLGKYGIRKRETSPRYGHTFHGLYVISKGESHYSLDDVQFNFAGDIAARSLTRVVPDGTVNIVTSFSRANKSIRNYNKQRAREYEFTAAEVATRASVAALSVKLPAYSAGSSNQERTVNLWLVGDAHICHVSPERQIFKIWQIPQEKIHFLYGDSPFIIPWRIEFPLTPGDYLILGTSELTEGLDEQTIQKIFTLPDLSLQRKLDMSAAASLLQSDPDATDDIALLGLYYPPS